MTFRPPRLQLFEFCDLASLPKRLRTIFHDTLVFSTTLTRQSVALATVLQSIVQKYQVKTVLELASGNGVEMAKVFAALPREQRPCLVLSDISPQVESYKRVQQTLGADYIEYITEPVSFFQNQLPQADVVVLNRALHHLRPEQVRTLILNATAQSKGILFVEAFERTWLAVFALLVLGPLFALGSALHPRTFTLSGFLLSWVLPIVPLIFTWDSVVSVLRCYTEEELRALLPEEANCTLTCGIHQQILGVRAVYCFVSAGA